MILIEEMKMNLKIKITNRKIKIEKNLLKLDVIEH
jgi:hypothetical protein